MTRENIRKLKVGDTIKIKATHFREGTFTGLRKVITKPNSNDHVGVKLWGWNPFYLYPHEILEKIN